MRPVRISFAGFHTKRIGSKELTVSPGVVGILPICEFTEISDHAAFFGASTTDCPIKNGAQRTQMIMEKVSLNLRLFRQECSPYSL